MKETFTKQVKEEISLFPFEDKEIFPLLSGYIKVNGNLIFRGSEKILTLKTENAKVAKLIYNALKSHFKVLPSFSYSRKMKLNKNVVYHIVLKEKVDEILSSLELSDGVFNTYPKHLVLDEGLRFFIAGAFLASGSVNSPDSDNYHLQFVVSEEEDAKYFFKLLNRFRNEKTMEFKILARRNKYVLYLKKADQITTFLTLIGAQESMFRFENSRIEKDFINSDNRLTICMTANYQRTKKKSDEQLEDIALIEKHAAQFTLGAKEQALCKLRKENPEASLMLLSEMLNEEYGFKISKSGVNHLFNSIHDKATFLAKENK